MKSSVDDRRMKSLTREFGCSEGADADNNDIGYGEQEVEARDNESVVSI